MTKRDGISVLPDYRRARRGYISPIFTPYSPSNSERGVPRFRESGLPFSTSEATCFSEYAVHVVYDTSCSSYSTNSCIFPSLIPSIQNVVTCLYKINLSSSRKQILISLSWSKTNLSHDLNIIFGYDPSTSTAVKLNTNPRIFKKLKGSRNVKFHNSSIEVLCDLSAARYETGSEPVDGFYVLIIVDSQLGLIVGDLGEEASQRRLAISVNPTSILISQASILRIRRQRV
ncbi:hypothetical protein ACS0TY_027435 [Phlomoides rotata]